MRGLGLVLVVAACKAAPEPPHVMMDFTRANVFDAPVPADDLMGRVPINDPHQFNIVEQVAQLQTDTDGFATTGGVFFQTSVAIDPSGLPDIPTSMTAASPAFVIGIDPAAPDFGVRYPLEVTFEPMGDSYGAPNLVTLLPLQGQSLRPGTRYAAVLTTDLHAATGEALAAASSDALAKFPGVADAVGVDASRIAGLTAFTTGHPADLLGVARQTALARPLPVIDAPFANTDEGFADFCVYHTTIPMPDWQVGDPPFTETGGTWQLDGSGAPIFQRTEEANLVVTIPHTPAPPGGYPLVVFIRTGGGGDRPLVDRGQQPGPNLPPIEPGEGPARYLARAGFAGIEVDGPLGGLRNTTNANEDFTIFNIQNLGAMRDNLRESAIELDVLAHFAVQLSIDTSDCTGASATATFDASHVALMGHSMGAWIAPLAAAFEPMFGAMILSGAGGSFIENIMYKQQPTPPYPVVVALLHVDNLQADHPMMTMSQWSLESADPAVYDRLITKEPPPGVAPRHVLMIQGIVDDYILPRIANTLSMSVGLDLAGAEIDTENDPRLAQQLTLSAMLPIEGRSMIALPAADNLGSATGVVTQHMEDGVEDGHEVMFQEDPPKHEYQCFLASWLATGMPSVPTAADRDAPCP